MFWFTMFFLWPPTIIGVEKVLLSFSLRVVPSCKLDLDEFFLGEGEVAKGGQIPTTISKIGKN